MGRGDLQLDIVYLDFVVKALLLKIFDFGSSETSRANVFLVNGGDLDPNCYDDKLKYSREALEKYPFMKCFWYPGNVTTTYYPYYLWRVYVYQLLPSLLLDVVLKRLGKPSIAMALQRRAHTGNMELKHFLVNSFESNQIDELRRLSKIAEDTNFTISEYADSMTTVEKRSDGFGTHMLGIRRHLLKEDDSTIPTALIKFRMFVSGIASRIQVNLVSFQT